MCEGIWSCCAVIGCLCMCVDISLIGLDVAQQQLNDHLRYPADHELRLAQGAIDCNVPYCPAELGLQVRGGIEGLQKQQDGGDEGEELRGLGMVS